MSDAEPLPMRPRSDPALWDRLAAISFDNPAASFALSQRLARENGWPQAFATRVIEEYRRFAYLAQVAGEEVTPSDEVDQAWHLHLLYTRHYWGPFTEAMGRPLHHGPTKGGAAEGTRFEDQYARTLAAYAQEFGGPAPADIWPPARIRFGKAPSARRVYRSDYWLIRKPARAVVAVTGILGAAGLLFLPLPSQAHERLPKELSVETVIAWLGHLREDHPFQLAFFVMILLIVVFAVMFRRDDRGDGGSGGCGGGGDSGCGGCGGCGG